MDTRISRRAFARRVGVITAGALGASIAAACAPTPTVAPSQQPAATSAPTVAPTLAPTPKPVGPVSGGTLRIDTNQVIDDVDPSTAWSHVEWCISGRLLFEGLMEFDRKGKLSPRLADGLPQVSDDGKTYTFKIRKGVKWHNGRDVVAADFKYGLERATNPDTGSWGQSYMNQVVGYQDFVDKKATELEGIKVLDEYTLQIGLTGPQALFLTLLMSTSNFPVPKEEVEKAGDKWGKQVVVGNGPFIVTEWVPDQKMVLTWNKDYWDQSLPHVDSQEFNMKIEPAVSLLKLAKGEIDMMTSNIDPEIVRTVKDDPKWTDFINKRPSMTSMWMFMNMELAPFDNLKVRQALNHALDRDAMIRIAGGGTPLFGVYPPGMPAYDPNFKPYPYDPEKAKALLKEAGLADGFKTTLTYSTDYAVWVTVAPIVQQQLAAIGVTAELTPLSHTAFIAEINTPKKVPLGFQEWAAVFPDPNDMIGPQFTCDARGVTGANNAYYCNQELQTLLAQAESTIDAQQRADLYKKMDEMIMAEAPHVPLYAPELYMLLHPRVKGYDFHASMWAADAYMWIDPSVK